MYTAIPSRVHSDTVTLFLVSRSRTRGVQSALCSGASIVHFEHLEVLIEALANGMAEQATERSRQPRKVTDETFKNQLLHKLDELRKSNNLCDINLRAEGQDFPAHRCVLSAASDYFRALFSSELQVKENQNNLVELNEVKCSVLAKVLLFIYTGEINIGAQNAHDLVMVGDYLIIPSLKTKASQFLEESIDVSNCIALELFASQYNCESLKLTAIKHKHQHFDAFVKSKDFLSLGFEQVKELMCQDELQISEEEEVYEAIITWVRHDLESRECFFPDLLKCLRLFSMSKYSLRMILDKEELVTKNPGCTSILTKGLDFFLFPDLFLGMSLRHRTSIEREEHVVILTGGVDPDMMLTRHVWCLVLATKKWHWLTKIPSSLLSDEDTDIRCASAVCCGQLFLLPDNSASLSCFDPQTGRWKAHKPGNTGLPIDLSRTLTSFNENLYVIGGEKYPHTVARYSPIRNKWKKLASMEAGRAGHCAVSLGDLIYVITGFRDQVCLQSAESYNPLTNQWVKIPDLAKARRFASAVATCGKILVLGGFCDMADTNDVEFSCEVFDPCVNQWSLVASPAVPRAASAIASVDETVYVFGGENEERFLDDVEMLDVKSNEWHQISCTLPETLSYAQASLLKLPKKLLKQS